jgi:peroxin-13
MSNSVAVMSNGAPISSAASGAAALPSSSLNPPALPDRPEALSSVINRTASSYSSYNSNGYGASPYGYGGYSGYNSYSSPYNRFGSGYGSMYGGGYGGAPGSMYGGMPGMSGMYGRMGMPGDPNNPNNPSLTQSFGQNTQATFQLIEGIVNAFGGFAQMLESTYMATHSSFFGKNRLLSMNISRSANDFCSYGCCCRTVWKFKAYSWIGIRNLYINAMDKSSYCET